MQSLEKTLPDEGRKVRKTLKRQKDSRAGLSWGGKSSHTPSPGGAILLMALHALKNTKADQVLFSVKE